MLATAVYAGSVVEWTRDQAAEGKFAQLGVTYDFAPSIPLSLIDREASLQNQARLSASKLNQDLVDEYALAMMEGASFPALVAFPLPSGTYLLAGGNHRLAAAYEAKRQTVALYIIRSNDEAMRRLIITSLNTLVGWRPERSETIEQAIAWVEKYGRTQKAAAAFYGVPPHALSRELTLRGVRRRLQLAGVPVSALSNTYMERLAQIQNDIVLRDVALFQAEVRLTERDLVALVRDVRDQRTEAGQLAVIQQWRDRDDLKLRKVEIAKGKPSPTVKARADLFRGLNSANGVLAKHASRSQLGLTNDDEFCKAKELARNIVVLLEAIGETPR